MRDISAIILAAGKGTRMASDIPKVLSNICGKPMLSYVLQEIKSVAPKNTHIVVGYRSQEVINAFPSTNLSWHIQEQQKGTAHAVSSALDSVKEDDIVLVTYGDMPLLQASTYQRIISATTDNDFVLLTACLEVPDGYGRIMRSENGEPLAIVEQSDASEEQMTQKEVNLGVIAVKASVLRELIAKVDNKNEQQEYYLTDCLALAVAKGLRVATVVLQDMVQTRGVNSMREINQAECLMSKRQVLNLADKALIKDINRMDVRGEVRVGKGVVFDVGVILEGDVVIGDNVYIGPYTIIKDSAIADDSRIEALCCIDSVKIGKQCCIGPYARLRPQTQIADQVRVGNFVEIKKSHLADQAKVNHLSYIGDSKVGRAVNIGAGTITCNYDGANKYQTIIEDNVFIGSNSALIAPLTIGKGATVGAGSTINQDVPPDTLGLSRSKQKEIKGWKRPPKDKK